MRLVANSPVEGGTLVFHFGERLVFVLARLLVVKGMVVEAAKGDIVLRAV